MCPSFFFFFFNSPLTSQYSSYSGIVAPSQSIFFKVAMPGDIFGCFGGKLYDHSIQHFMGRGHGYCYPPTVPGQPPPQLSCHKVWNWTGNENLWCPWLNFLPCHSLHLETALGTVYDSYLVAHKRVICFAKLTESCLLYTAKTESLRTM